MRATSRGVSVNILYQGKQFAEFIKNSTEKEILDFLLELRETIMTLKAENRALKEQIRQQIDDKPSADRVVQYGKFVYSENDPDHQRPYCLKCWAFDRKLEPMALVDDGTGMQVKCKACAKRV